MADTCIDTSELQKSISLSTKQTPTNSKSNNKKSPHIQLLGVVSIPLIIIIFLVCIIIFCFSAVAILPLLLISYIITRLLQFIRHDEHGYIKATQVKLIIRNALCIDVLLILLGISLIKLYLIISKNNNKNLSQDYSQNSNVIYIVCALYLLSFLLLKSVHAMLIKVSDHAIVEAITEIIDCGIFLWAMYEVEQDDQYDKFGLKDEFMLGFDGYDWIRALIILLIGYNIITLFTHLIVFTISIISRGRKKNSRSKVLFERMNNKYLVYYANGLNWSVDSVLTVLMLLVAWKYYFNKHVNNENDAIWRFGLRSIISLLICALLWLIKTVVLLAWKAHTVYERLEHRIVDNGRDLYDLSFLGDSFYIFDQDKDRDKRLLVKMKKKCGEFDKILLRKDPSVDDVKRIVQCFLVARSHLCKETYTNDIQRTISELSDDCLREKLKQLIIDGDDTKKLLNECEKEEKKECGKEEKNEEKKESVKEGKNEEKNSMGTTLHQKITTYIGYCGYVICFFICFSNVTKSRKFSKEENKCHDQQIEVQRTSNKNFVVQELNKKDLTLLRHQLAQWVVRAHSGCMILANTLSSAKEVADCLNNIFSVLILGVTFITWLLLTGLTDTKVLVLVTSPLLAATFIFGNTCKLLFQSIIFVFVVHPFDVGDLCVIDDNLLEVKTVGIWKTTFSKVGWQEEVTYPSSELSNKKIINHKTDIDWNDHVEFDVGAISKHKIYQLKQDIEKYLDDNKDKFAPEYNCVEVTTSTTGDSIKIIIDFKHKKNLKNSTYFECLKEKRKLRSEFVLHVQDLLDHKKSNGSNISGVCSCGKKINPPASVEEVEEENVKEQADESEKESSKDADKDTSKDPEITEVWKKHK